MQVHTKFLVFLSEVENDTIQRTKIHSSMKICAKANILRVLQAAKKKPHTEKCNEKHLLNSPIANTYRVRTFFVFFIY